MLGGGGGGRGKGSIAYRDCVVCSLSFLVPPHTDNPLPATLISAFPVHSPSISFIVKILFRTRFGAQLLWWHHLMIVPLEQSVLTSKNRTEPGQNRTHLGKCTHQYDETQGNNDTRALSTKFVFFGCKKIDI